MKLESKEAIKKERLKKKISYLLENFLQKSHKEYLTFGEIRDSLEGRAFAGLMLVFVLPNLIPLPIPGISTILGTPLIILSFQFMMGRKSPWFPKWLKEKKISRAKIAKAINYILPYIKRFEVIFSPKFSILAQPPFERILASCCLISAIIMALPIPLANWMPALSIFTISIAILERDGLFAILGISIFLAAMTLTYTIIFTILKGGFFFLERLF